MRLTVSAGLRIVKATPHDLARARRIKPCLQSLATLVTLLIEVKTVRNECGSQALGPDAATPLC
jgi:hypothetical protein